MVNTQKIVDAIAAIADGCSRPTEEVKAWVSLLFNPNTDHHEAFSSILDVITSNYHGFVAVKLNEDGHIVDMHIPGNLKGDQIAGLRDPRRR